MEELGELLSDLRRRSGLPMAGVIERLGVPRSTAYSWEAPGARPHPEHLQRLLDLYDATDAERLEAWRLRASVPPSIESSPGGV